MQQYEKSITGSTGTGNCKRLYSVQEVLLIKKESLLRLSFLLLTEEILLLFDGFLPQNVPVVYRSTVPDCRHLCRLRICSSAGLRHEDRSQHLLRGTVRRR